ncbi:HSP20 family protein [Chitinophaga skermanii]|uniref:HSP20 family protein n=1 Tax=Chitinophaga skermanii TaxID=331697 RepID=A0A327QFZ9_9BACT|nr:Hsp20/alpha crystallin family protein [Chitinophaga skermanii]RAJ02233.1 HSP20 family protein [Chitinophaga skermanii]
MTTVKFNQHPAKSFNGLLDEVFGHNGWNKLFKDEVAPHFFSTLPPVNITESKEGYVLDIVAPGFEKADFKINLDGKSLVVSVEKKETVKNENEKQVRREYNFQGFKRSFTLDENVDAEKINAKYENGVLKLTLPKKEKQQDAAKEIVVA